MFKRVKTTNWAVLKMSVLMLAVVLATGCSGSRVIEAEPLSEVVPPSTNTTEGQVVTGFSLADAAAPLDAAPAVARND